MRRRRVARSGAGGAIEIESAAEARTRITGAVDAATLKARWLMDGHDDLSALWERLSRLCRASRRQVETFRQRLARVSV
jgi:hypothetical protein